MEFEFSDCGVDRRHESAKAAANLRGGAPLCCAVSQRMIFSAPPASCTSVRPSAVLSASLAFSQLVSSAPFEVSVREKRERLR